MILWPSVENLLVKFRRLKLRRFVYFCSWFVHRKLCTFNCDIIIRCSKTDPNPALIMSCLKIPSIITTTKYISSISKMTNYLLPDILLKWNEMKSISHHINDPILINDFASNRIAHLRSIECVKGNVLHLSGNWIQ